MSTYSPSTQASNSATWPATVNNGLTYDSGNNLLQWGGDLIKNTVINGKTFDWSFTADDGGNDRNVIAWDQSAAQLSFGEAANNYPVTGTWYLSPTNQAGYLTFTTYDAPDTAIEIGVDANNYSQVRLYNGSSSLGIDMGRTGANSWGVTLGDDTNQTGKLILENWSGTPAIEVYRSGVLRGRIDAIGGYYGDQGIFHNTSQSVTAKGGDSGTPGSTMVSMGTRGLEINNAVNIGGVLTDRLRIGSKDFTAGTTMMALNFEGSPVQAAAVTNTHNVPIEINGTTYYILLASTR